jgi:DNA-binding SARP family transcriptional activator/Tfp pilus assembly protein PilF
MDVPARGSDEARVRLLGPVDVLVGDTPRPVHGLRRKAILAALALQPGEIVSADRLLDIAWDGRAPATALQSHMSRLRTVLGDRSAILARPPGYVLTVGTDVQSAEHLIRQGTEAADPRERETHLRAAIALWRDRPLADFAALAWFDDHARRLEQLLLQARSTLVDARLALGQHAQLIPELEDLCRQNPLHEQLFRQLMLALYRAGRQSDALATYHRLRRTLDEELGVDPSQPLRDLETAILRQDPILDLPSAPPPVPSAPPRSVPAQLPLAIGVFTGRTRELAFLDSLVPRAGEPGPTAVVISAISGTAGIGKTTLAVHWAHRVADRFPDGQLYVNLRGFDPSGPAVDPSAAVRGFLEAFGVPAKQIPASLDAQVGKYRSVLAGKRVLVVLDNARDARQIRPLLPASPGCFAVVTSRNHPGPLVATEAAYPLTLDLLSTVEARDLLAKRLGADRVNAEPAAVDEIIARCSYLPLALVITAARAAAHPHFPLAALAAQLRETAATLDAFDADGDPATDVRSVFSWSYRMLSPGAARLFRLLGLHPGPDISPPAAASLAAVPLDQARTLLAELARAHLISEHIPGRFTFHDLLRAYARELAHSEDDEPERRTAVHRMLDHYLYTAYSATLLLNPKRDPPVLAEPLPGVVPEPLHTHDAALDWCGWERFVLVAAVEQAAADGFDTHTWQLSWALRTFLLRRGLWEEQVAIEHMALEAARRLGDRAGQATALRGLALAYTRWDRLGDAEPLFDQALNLYTELGDAKGQADIHTSLAEVAEKQGRPADSLRHAQQALDQLRVAGDRAGEAYALNAVGWSYALLENYEQALTYCTQALELLEEVGNRDGQAATWDSIGYAYRGLGDYEKAAECYQRAIDLFRELGDRPWEAYTLSSLGDMYEAAGHPDLAGKTWEQAMQILEEINHPDADRLRGKLSR